MKVKEMAITALFLAIGLVLHQITVGLVAGMKPDFVITMLFVSFLVIRNARLTLPAGLAAGIIAALTTTMAGGQLPNIIDKPITAAVAMGLIKLLGGRINDYLLAGLVGLIGTFVSGLVFITAVALIIGLPAPFMALFVTVVVPTAVINTFLTPFLYGIALAPARSLGLAAHAKHSA
ncbi:MAG TPA: tryptophan transporter [Firmicutes bacterium]|nr:tryptophan transporter [Bacillota bacterium]